MTEHPNLAAALVAALKTLTVVEKDAHADVGSYGYDYATLPGLVNKTRPVLAEHGIVALNPLHDHGNGLACTVVLLHESGERLDFGPFPFPHGRDAQATGSMVTYHRRYALLAALGMAAGDDDDGASAAARQEPSEDQYVPGLRSSVDAAIKKWVGDPPDEDKATALKQWFADNDLPAVRRMTADQCGVVIEHLMELAEPSDG